MTKTVRSIFSSGGNLSTLSSTTGTAFVTFSSQVCKRVTISNNSGTTLEVQQGGTGDAFPVFPFSYMTFSGLSNATDISVRRADNTNTQVTINARWES